MLADKLPQPDQRVALDPNGREGEIQVSPCSVAPVGGDLHSSHLDGESDGQGTGLDWSGYERMLRRYHAALTLDFATAFGPVSHSAKRRG